MTTMAVEQLVRGDATQRAMAAWELRVVGNTWQQIADQLDYSHPQAAHRAVTEFRGSTPAIDGQEIRRELHERSEWLWQQACQDVVDQKPGAVTAAVRTLDRLSRLLGADAPTRVAVAHFQSVAGELYASDDDDAPVLPSMPSLAELMPADD
jgi:hypothetical protein